MSPPTTATEYNQYPTPIKAKVQGAIEFCDRMNLSYYKEDIF